MRVKKIVLLAVMLGIVNVALAAALVDPVLPKGFGPWQNAQVGEFMTVRVPGKFKGTSIELGPEVRQKIDSLENYNLENTGDDYLCMVTNIIYNKGIMGDLDGAADGAINNMKKDPSITDMKVDRKYIKRFNINGILLTGKMMTGGKKATIETEIFIRRNVMWMIMILDSNEKKLTEISQAVIDSMLIKAE